MTENVPYQSYLLRVWPARRAGATGCRISLQTIATGESANLAGLDSLLTFLEARLANEEFPIEVTMASEDEPPTGAAEK